MRSNHRLVDRSLHTRTDGGYGEKVLLDTVKLNKSGSFQTNALSAVLMCVSQGQGPIPACSASSVSFENTISSRVVEPQSLCMEHPLPENWGILAVLFNTYGFNFHKERSDAFKDYSNLFCNGLDFFLRITKRCNGLSTKSSECHF